MIKIISAVLLLLCHIYTNAQSDMKLIYVGDPMCSWCYGFGPEWQETMDLYKDQMEVEYVMGGLRPYYEKPMTEMKSFLTEHWEQVHNATGQPFTYKILDRSDLNYDTEPPCRAVTIVGQLKEEAVPQFFSKVQSLFYFHNKDMNQSISYHAILQELGVDINDFDIIFNSKEGKDAVKANFKKAMEMGVQSFPTVLIEHEGEHYIVAHGYAKSEVVAKSIERLTSKLTK